MGGQFLRWLEESEVGAWRHCVGTHPGVRDKVLNFDPRAESGQAGFPPYPCKYPSL